MVYPIDVMNSLIVKENLTEEEINSSTKDIKEIFKISYNDYISKGEVFTLKSELYTLVVKPLLDYIIEYKDSDASLFMDEVMNILDLETVLNKTFLKGVLNLNNLDFRKIQEWIESNSTNYKKVIYYFDELSSIYTSKQIADLGILALIENGMTMALFLIYDKLIGSEKEYVENTIFELEDCNKIIFLCTTIDSKFYTLKQIEERIIGLGKYPTFEYYDMQATWFMASDDFDQDLWEKFVYECGNEEDIKFYKELLQRCYDKSNEQSKTK